MINNYFVVTKPLQYCNATNIAYTIDSNKILLVIDLFNDAERFYEGIKNVKFWNKVYFLKSSKETYKLLELLITPNDNLFIDSDYGILKMYWLFRIKTKKIYVYEEGSGSYRNDLLASRKLNNIIKLFLKIIGVKNHFGGSHFVKGIYLYDIDKHMSLVSDFKNERYKFSTDFQTNLNKIADHFNYQYVYIDDFIDKSIKSKKTFIYLTSWEYNKSIELLLNYSNNLWVIKPHPHILYGNKYDQFDLVLEPFIFMELVIVKLLENNIEFEIIHESSSTLLYFPNVKNRILK